MINNLYKTKDFLGNEWEINCIGCAMGNDLMIVPGGIIKKIQYFCVHQDPLIPLEGFYGNCIIKTYSVNFRND